MRKMTKSCVEKRGCRIQAQRSVCSRSLWHKHACGVPKELLEAAIYHFPVTPECHDEVSLGFGYCREVLQKGLTAVVDIDAVPNVGNGVSREEPRVGRWGFTCHLTMRLSDAGLRQHRTKALYPNHRLPPWLNEDDTRDRSNRLLGDATATLLECMTQEAQRPNPNADNITPVRHRQSPTKSGCRSGELTVPVKYEET
jgi:hypothetical protein